MLDFIVQGFVLVVIAAAFYYAGVNRAYVLGKYGTKYPWLGAVLPDWSRKETP